MKIRLGVDAVLVGSRVVAVRIFTARDAPERPLSGERVSVIGYGNLGRTAALNLRDSGARVRVGNVDDAYATQARADGFDVVSVRTAAEDDVVYALLPDEVMPDVFPRDVSPGLRPRAAVAFASGYCLAYRLVTPPAGVDVLLVAPRMGGEAARARYTSGHGFWAYVGVEHDASGTATNRMLGLAAGIGALRAGALEMSATTEATIDLFIEQSVGAILGASMMTAFELGVEAGVPAEALVLEMYMSGEMESVFQAFRERGFFKASESHGPTALFGGLARTMEIDREALSERFRVIREEIRSGQFAQRFQDERAAGYPMLEIARQMIHVPSPISEAEERVRAATQRRGDD